MSFIVFIVVYLQKAANRAGIEYRINLSFSIPYFIDASHLQNKGEICRVVHVN
jgi:hypothetical protein